MGANGVIHLKTDEPVLYDFTLEVLDKDPECIVRVALEDIHAVNPVSVELDIVTYYERAHLQLGKTIKYIQWSYCE